MDQGPDPRHYLAPTPNNHLPSIPPPPNQTAPSKKRRSSTTATATGSRGVANLTPEQLAKKRANDREAQRAIRERTKGQIESLERKIQELTSQQPYQELQHAIRQKELVEAENEEIKKHLSSILAIVQPLIGGASLIGRITSLSSVSKSSPLTMRFRPQSTSGSKTRATSTTSNNHFWHFSCPNNFQLQRTSYCDLDAFRVYTAPSSKAYHPPGCSQVPAPVLLACQSTRATTKPWSP